MFAGSITVAMMMSDLSRQKGRDESGTLLRLGSVIDTFARSAYPHRCSGTFAW